MSWWSQKAESGVNGSCLGQPRKLLGEPIDEIGRDIGGLVGSNELGLWFATVPAVKRDEASAHLFALFGRE